MVVLGHYFGCNGPYWVPTGVNICLTKSETIHLPIWCILILSDVLNLKVLKLYQKCLNSLSKALFLRINAIVYHRYINPQLSVKYVSVGEACICRNLPMLHKTVCQKILKLYRSIQVILVIFLNVGDFLECW